MYIQFEEVKIAYYRAYPLRHMVYGVCDAFLLTVRSLLEEQLHEGDEAESGISCGEFAPPSQFPMLSLASLIDERELGDSTAFALSGTAKCVSNGSELIHLYTSSCRYEQDESVEDPSRLEEQSKILLEVDNCIRSFANVNGLYLSFPHALSLV